MRSSSTSFAVVLAASIACVSAVSLMSRETAIAHEENPSEYNYYKHAQPILATHCGGCHRPGGVGPMSLLDYEDAIPWANAMKLQLLEGTMPPWLPDDGSAPLLHARSLTPEELNVLVDWAAGQTPEGDRAESTLDVIAGGGPASLLEGMDRIVSSERPVVLGEDDYELDACVVFPTDLG